MDNFSRIAQLPPYVFTITGESKQRAIARGLDVIDLAMGNPDQGTPPHIVEALQREADNQCNHRYSQSQGLRELRQAICDWYQERYQVQIDPDLNSVVTIGSKEGISHLALATTNPGEKVLIPDPCYPIHRYGFIIAGAELVPLSLAVDASDQLLPINYLQQLRTYLETTETMPKWLVLNYPANPSGHCVELSFFKEIIELAKTYGFYVLNDLAYADLGFEGYRPPSILQVSGALDVAVESFSLSKSYNMAGWRVGFINGNQTLVAALRRIKTYMDYGLFAAIEKAAIAALTGPQQCLTQIREVYQKRRDVLCKELQQINWPVKKPLATMFVWGKISESFFFLRIQ